MKNLTIRFVMVCRPGLLLIFFFTYTLMNAQTNRALLVGISHYPKASGWENIHATNDCELIKNILTENGYDNNNIAILIDKNATKRNIIAQLNTLYQESSSGDYVYIQFSGHGQQMMDDNGDEDDGLDEAMIPYDAEFWYIKGKYEGENHLRDDEIGKWLRRLRSKVGERGNVTFLLDACHSGTGNRDNEGDYIRGTGYVFAPDNYIPVAGRNQHSTLTLRKEKGLSPVAVFSACLPDEINYEYYNKKDAGYYGLLTFAFGQVFRDKNHSRTEEQFYHSLVTKMQQLTSHKKNRKQTPYFESSDKSRIFKIGIQK